MTENQEISVPEIPGGYVLLSRQIIESDLMNKQPMVFKLWIWLLCKARRKPTSKYRVGEVFTTIEEMRDAMSWFSGYRKIRPTRDEVRRAYGSLAEALMATTTKTTRGIVINILNFEKYQDPKNYEAHTGGHAAATRRPHGSPYYTQQGNRGERGVKRDTVIDPEFVRFWDAYPRKLKKAEALKAWQRAMRKPPIDYILEQLEKWKASGDWTKEGGRYVPHPTTWINGERWNDEPYGYGSTGYNWREEEDRPKDWSTVPNSDWILEEEWPEDIKPQ
ncbi:hypothetical protein [Desulfonatronum lacustre]|uniref:hypothetical protein n=1 Tax=Desulfonatronum lacustre TaxID=66849 RepID=UPI00048F13E4|nr:hypothetical protein [Desulfonatronum lacustre]